MVLCLHARTKYQSLMCTCVWLCFVRRRKDNLAAIQKAVGSRKPSHACINHTNACGVRLNAWNYMHSCDSINAHTIFDLYVFVHAGVNTQTGRMSISERHEHALLSAQVFCGRVWISNYAMHTRSQTIINCVWRRVFACVQLENYSE